MLKCLKMTVGVRGDCLFFQCIGRIVVHQCFYFLFITLSSRQIMFGSSLPPFVWGFLSYLRYLCLFVYSGVRHVLCCVFCLFVFVLYTVCCRFLWFSTLRYSLTFISKEKKNLTYTDTNKLEGRTLIGHITFPSVNKSREVVVIYKVN